MRCFDQTKSDNRKKSGASFRPQLESEPNATKRTGSPTLKKPRRSIRKKNEKKYRAPFGFRHLAIRTNNDNRETKKAFVSFAKHFVSTNSQNIAESTSDFLSNSEIGNIENRPSPGSDSARRLLIVAGPCLPEGGPSLFDRPKDQVRRVGSAGASRGLGFTVWQRALSRSLADRSPKTARVSRVVFSLSDLINAVNRSAIESKNLARSSAFRSSRSSTVSSTVRCRSRLASVLP